MLKGHNKISGTPLLSSLFGEVFYFLGLACFVESFEGVSTVGQVSRGARA